MIPSRGLRWSSQTIGIGRRRIEAFSSRQFSSSTVQHGPIRASPLLSQHTTSISRAYTKSQLSPINVLIRNGTGARFASTAPAVATTPITNATTASTTPVEAASSAASTPSDYVTSLDSATEFASDSLYNIPEHIGYLKSLGLDYGYGPTGGIEWLLEHIHIFTGTPWWISIAITAVAVRAVLFKPYIDAAENAARMAQIMPLTKPIQAKMMAAQRASNMDGVMQARQELSLINKRAGIKLWKSFVPMVQVFAGYGTFVLLRAMAKLPVPGLETGGILWFSNLAIPDPLLILPIATAGVLHWVLRRGGEMGTSNFSPAVFNAMKWGLPAASLLFTWWLPAAVQLSFFVSGLMSFGQATLFRQSWFREYFNMTPLPTNAIPGKKSDPVAASPYKGKLKLAANPVLSQAELSSRFQGAQKSALNEKLGKIRQNNPPGGGLGNVIDGAFKDVKGTVDEIKEAGSGVVSSAKELMGNRSDKYSAKQAKLYEEKKQEQLKKERWEREAEKWSERAARKSRR
ncbi:hypothetical protein L207DRAFT_568225 [Hyaloscypha variabilis F]|uniref:Membrane insertase YidC/Oxa/ALB C-terminal domain-containing protein n=1 Tax=Hyaloscypha variabilis (strain UAMH 11265 / GT02V1 / F) TaxID=1149755 RepID=A0A2J6RFB2_HYAVF|nr:hypothetical protein L207DRAFT_568225 [Hyaloscypha variabilis F]